VLEAPGRGSAQDHRTHDHHAWRVRWQCRVSTT
jgi:hypothetical protein